MEKLGHLRRIQISPLPSDADEAEAEQAITCQSPPFSFADSVWSGRKQPGQRADRPTSPRSLCVMSGRAIKAEVKLMVKTADVGKEAIEIRSIREFVELDPPQSTGPFSRIFQTEPCTDMAAIPRSPPSQPRCVDRRNRGRIVPTALGKGSVRENNPTAW